MVCHFNDILDATSQYRVLETFLAVEGEGNHLQTISKIEQVSPAFREHAKSLWKSWVVTLNVSIPEDRHPKHVAKTIEEIRKNYPSELIQEVKLSRLVHMPILDLNINRKSINPLSNNLDLPLIIKPEKLEKPLMRGVDLNDRPFISILCEDDTGEKNSITIHRSSKESVQWTLSQGNGIYSKITFSSNDPKFVKLKKLLSDDAISMEAPGQRNLLKMSK